MAEYSNRVVAYTVRIIKGLDNRDSDNRGPTVLPYCIIEVALDWKQSLLMQCTVVMQNFTISCPYCELAVEFIALKYVHMYYVPFQCYDIARVICFASMSKYITVTCS